MHACRQVVDRPDEGDDHRRPAGRECSPARGLDVEVAAVLEQSQRKARSGLTSGVEGVLHDVAEDHEAVLGADPLDDPRGRRPGAWPWEGDARGHDSPLAQPRPVGAVRRLDPTCHLSASTTSSQSMSPSTPAAARVAGGAGRGGCDPLSAATLGRLTTRAVGRSDHRKVPLRRTRVRQHDERSRAPRGGCGPALPLAFALRTVLADQNGNQHAHSAVWRTGCFGNVSTGAGVQSTSARLQRSRTQVGAGVVATAPPTLIVTPGRRRR